MKHLEHPLNMCNETGEGSIHIFHTRFFACQLPGTVNNPKENI